MAFSVNQKMAIGAGVGIAAVALVLLASNTASAAPASSTPPGNTPALDPTSTLGQAAIALASAITTSGGYAGSQTAAIKAYQTAKGLTVDGYPGTNTMTSLRADLAAMGNTASGTSYSDTYPLVGTLTLYPWTSAGGWTTGNVPAAFAGSNGAALWAAGTTVGT